MVVLCEINGGAVKAVRYDGYSSKYDMHTMIKNEHPGWKIKIINRLYDVDFKDEIEG